jgi:hypothetical protein
MQGLAPGNVTGWHLFDSNTLFSGTNLNTGLCIFSGTYGYYCYHFGQDSVSGKWSGELTFSDQGQIAFSSMPQGSTPTAQSSFTREYKWDTTAATFMHPLIVPNVRMPLTTPATSSATCTVGDEAHDASYIYVCTATNTWKRATLATF